ncbi:MAG: hypothetical protein IJO48_05700 [Clostridia bacterium]|nr:hypothetical protein [Clostridia bacterium]
MITIHIAAIISLCVIIMSAFGVLEITAKRTQISAFELAFAGIIMLVLSNFSIFIIPELKINAAALCLPLYFMVVSVSKNENDKVGGITFLILFSLLTGIVGSAAHDQYRTLAVGVCCSVSGVVFRKTPAFALMIAALLPVSSSVFGAMTEFIRYSYASCDLSSNALLDTQAISCLLSGAVLSMVINKSKVIKA